jgi:hypothetical protein
MADIIRPEATLQVDTNFRTFVNSSKELADLFHRLPQRVIYYPIIAACYNRSSSYLFIHILLYLPFRIFYGRHKRPVNCPGPLRCELPPLPGIQCAIGVRNFGHATINQQLVIHFSQTWSHYCISSCILSQVVHYPLDSNGYFHISNSGCTIWSFRRPLADSFPYHLF